MMGCSVDSIHDHDRSGFLKCTETGLYHQVVETDMPKMAKLPTPFLDCGEQVDPRVNFGHYVKPDSYQAQVYNVELSANIMVIRNKKVTYLNEQMLYQQMITHMDEQECRQHTKLSYGKDWRPKVK